MRRARTWVRHHNIVGEVPQSKLDHADRGARRQRDRRRGLVRERAPRQCRFGIGRDGGSPDGASPSPRRARGPPDPVIASGRVARGPEWSGSQRRTARDSGFESIAIGSPASGKSGVAPRSGRRGADRRRGSAWSSCLGIASGRFTKARPAPPHPYAPLQVPRDSIGRGPATGAPPWSNEARRPEGNPSR